jgi:hypothetical protein
MSGFSMRIDGLDDLRALLRRLPAELRDEATGIVQGSANAAAEEIRAAYPDRTGNLRDHVFVSTTVEGTFGVGARVRNTAKHAWLFENGTQTRQTALGANRGAMPAGNVFIPRVIRHRTEMMRALRAMVEAHGLTVTGSLDLAA